MRRRDASLGFGRRRAEGLVRKAPRRREPHLVVRLRCGRVPRISGVADCLAPVPRSHRRRRFCPHLRKVLGRGKLAKGGVAPPPYVSERFEARRKQVCKRWLPMPNFESSDEATAESAEPRATHRRPWGPR